MGNVQPWLRVKMRLVRVLFLICRVLRSASWNGLRRAGKTVVLDFQDHRIFLRYHFGVAYAFQQAGYQVAWVLRPRTLARSLEFQMGTAWLVALRIRWLLRPPPAKTVDRNHWLMVVDRNDNRQQVQSRVVLTALTCEDRSGHEGLMMPFWGYPDFLLYRRRSGNHSKGTKRSFRISFVGNCDGRVYDSCGTVTRAKAKLLLYNEFHDRIHALRVWADKASLSNDFAADILFMDRMELDLTTEEYCCVLERTVFYLVLPGIGSMRTHSLYECLDMGCIPVMSGYQGLSADWVSGKNCLLFHSDQEFLTVVRDALRMTAPEVERLREAAVQTFERLYSPVAFVEAIENERPRSVLFWNV